MMRPPKQLLEAAKRDGTLERLNQLLSASQILLAEANNLIEEASDVIAAHGLMMGDLKQLHNRFTKAADNYFREFSTMVVKEETKMDMFGDIDTFDDSFRQWAKVPKGWKPKEMKNEE